ncbi:unnamed protein product [Calicophoron daubneyi]
MFDVKTIFRRLSGVQRLSLSRSSTGTVGSLVIPTKDVKSVDADIVNYGASGIYFSGYNEHGFLLNNGKRIFGACAAFPCNAFAWNVKDVNDIDEEALSLFFALEPPLDVLIIGKGETKIQANYREILNICFKHKLCVEVLPTQAAVGTFNFLNSEGRYVGCGVIPPRRLDVYDHADEKARKLLAAEEAENLIESQGIEFPKLQDDEPKERLQMPRSPLLGTGNSSK